MTYPRMAETRLGSLNCCNDQRHEQSGAGYECANCHAWWSEDTYVSLCEAEGTLYREQPATDGWTPPTWLVLATAATGLVICGLLWLAVTLMVQP